MKTIWDGAVMLEREDASRTMTPTVRIMSARSLVLNGRRAIAERVPYGSVKHYFSTKDGDHVFVRAELRDDGHLQLGESCTRSEWAETSHQSPN